MVQKVILVAVVTTYALMSQYVLNHWNQNQDFLFFITWNLFVASAVSNDHQILTRIIKNLFLVTEPLHKKVNHAL